MNIEDHTPFWIKALPAPPICDVPWLGNSLVLSNGDVNFCCFTDAVAGNVNEHSFIEIWNSNIMQHIRSELSAQRLPVECQAANCPIYRGDTTDFVHKRMAGSLNRLLTGVPEPSVVHSALRDVRYEAQLRTIAGGRELHLALDVSYDGTPVLADLFAGLRLVDGTVNFLPELDRYPVPLVFALPLAGHYRWSLPFALPRATSEPLELCLALFERDSNPHVAANCYWSSRGMLGPEE